MSRRTYRETDRFEIRAENGSTFTTVETTEFLHAYSHSGNSMIPGLKSPRTIDGYHVNFDGQKQYTIVELGLHAERTHE